MLEHRSGRSKRPGGKRSVPQPGCQCLLARFGDLGADFDGKRCRAAASLEAERSGPDRPAGACAAARTASITASEIHPCARRTSKGRRTAGTSQYWVGKCSEKRSGQNRSSGCSAARDQCAGAGSGSSRHARRSSQRSAASGVGSNNSHRGLFKPALSGRRASDTCFACGGGRSVRGAIGRGLGSRFDKSARRGGFRQEPLHRKTGCVERRTGSAQRRRVRPIGAGQRSEFQERRRTDSRQRELQCRHAAESGD